MNWSLDRVEVPFQHCTVSFRIPSHWVDVEEDGTGAMYAEPGRDDGALRLDVISVTTGESPAQERMREHLWKQEGDVVLLSNNNVLRYCTELSKRDESLLLHWWHLGCALRKDFYCIALFSYTLLRKVAASSDSRKMVAFLREEIRNATISPSILQ